MSLPDLFLIVIAPFVGVAIGILPSRWADGDTEEIPQRACSNCGGGCDWYLWVPVLGWLLRGGKCRECGARLSIFYPIVEILALLVALTAYYFAPPGTFILSCLMGWTLLALAAVDWRTFVLPDPLNALLAALGGIMIVTVMPERWMDKVIGALVGYGILFAVEVFYRVYRGREGLGRGDAKLLGAIGLWVGWMSLSDILLIASLAGLGFTLASNAFQRQAVSGQTALAFGPWLALAGWISWLCGPILVAV
ncbi:A24 family peptidase [Henriciella sp. AS95]|uniref:prepilin peptidase n=1 Tax=Henriciella sp. AS95 TaxID=3135782 RepID=UPI00316DFD50